MRILIIGGTGIISSAVSRALLAQGQELWLLNRGNRALPPGARAIRADMEDEAGVLEQLGGMDFDAVCDFICFTKSQAERDFRLFRGRTGQYVFISSASAYHKPAPGYIVNEGTSLANPYWEYARNKIACEEFLMGRCREDGFPVTIVRPSHTYGEKAVPVGLHGRKGSWQVVKRMLEGKPVLIHGDGTSLWTMTDSRDFAQGFTGLLGNPHAIGEAFQITSDETLTWNQIYRTIARCLGVELRPYHVSSSFLASVSRQDLTGTLLGDKANSVVFDNSKLKRAIPGFRPAIPFQQGVRHTLDYVLSHRECQVEDGEFDAWCGRVVEVLERAREELCRPKR